MGVLPRRVGVVPHVENTGIVEWQGDAMKQRMAIWGIVIVAICCALIAGSMLAKNSEERVVPRNIEQPLSSDRIKALAARGARAVVTEGRQTWLSRRA